VASTWGTSWHGSLGNDAFRRAFLAEMADLAGRDFTAAPDTSFAAVRQAHLDVMGDLVAAHLDTDALSRLIKEGPPPGLPVIPPAGAVPL
jgi:adenosylcobyric acid synthase